MSKYRILVRAHTVQTGARFRRVRVTGHLIGFLVGELSSHVLPQRASLVIFAALRSTKRKPQHYWRYKRARNVLFNDPLNTFYLRLYGVRHMVKYHTDSERGNLLPPHGLLFPISIKGSFICIIPHTTAFGIPVVEHWLKREIAHWVHPMKDRSDDPSHCKDHSDNEKGNPLPPHRLPLSINSKGSFICIIPQTG